MTRASFLGQVRLGVPLALSLMAEMVMLGTDTWVVSKLGVGSLASMSLAFNYAGILFVGGMGVMMVVNPLASRKMGAGEEEGGLFVVSNGVWLGFGIGFLLWLMILPSSAVLLLLGQSPDLVMDAEGYLYVMGPGISFALATISLRGFYASTGNSFYYGVIFTLGVLANGVLDFLFVFGIGDFAGWGLWGAGFATLVINILMFVSVLCVSLYHKTFRDFGLGRYLLKFPSRGVLKLILWTGIPVAVSHVVEETFFMGSTFLVGHLGRDALAIHQVMMVISLMTIGLVWGFGEAARAEMGWAYGRRDRDGFVRSMLTFLIVTVVIVGITFFAMRFFVDDLVEQFFVLEDSEEGIRMKFREIVLMWSWFVLPEVPIGLGVSVLYVLGYTKSKMVIDLCIYWVLIMPLLGWLIFERGSDIYWVWLWSGVAVTLVSLFTVLRAYWVLRSRVGW